MKLIDLEPIWWQTPKQPGQGVCFNCPGPCCSEARDLQAQAAAAEAAGAPDAAELRGLASNGMPFRVIAAFTRPVLASSPAASVALKLYERGGSDFDTLTIVEDIDRTEMGHVRMRITNGEVMVVDE